MINDLWQWLERHGREQVYLNGREVQLKRVRRYGRRNAWLIWDGGYNPSLAAFSDGVVVQPRWGEFEDVALVLVAEGTQGRLFGHNLVFTTDRGARFVINGAQQSEEVLV